MFCRNCGKEISDIAAVCVNCGVPAGRGTTYCQICGTQTNAIADFCVKCGSRLVSKQLKSKLAAGLLGIFLGGFGVHRFYLGYVGIGIAQIAVTFITCGIGALWGLIEGILILTGNINKDSQGNPLGD
jgi:TM2 domain-containing membrane protein YozV